MSHYGAGVEYALHILLQLTEEPEAGAVPSARDLADFLGLPAAFVRKLMTKLERADIVAGAEGIEGGWRLAKSPARITALAVAEAVEGRKPLFECREVRANCVLYGAAPPKHATQGVCSIHAVMIEAEKKMRESLAARTLADIRAKVDTVRPKSAAEAGRRWFENRASSRRG